MIKRVYSLGGSVVAESLRSAGFQLETPRVYLVETNVPTSARPSSLLAQSLWNVLPAAEFVRALDQYPKKMKARAIARREVARINLRRAEKVVCLTNTMAAYTESFAGREVQVSPVCLPLDAVDLPKRSAQGTGDGTVLVPGTVTWYKRPHEALLWTATRQESGFECVRLAGGDDGSGCLKSVRRLATHLGVDLIHGPLKRDEMWGAMMRASAVVLPSSLESLGFSVGEALWCGRMAVASPIAAHVEVADRVGVWPTWLNSGPGVAGTVGRLVEPDEIVEQWKRLGAALGLDAR